MEKEERTRQAEQLRNKSITSIYKQLAKVLHPDLEPDAERKQAKGTLMQELTAAYRNNDLHESIVDASLSFSAFRLCVANAASTMSLC